jgi:acetoin utilization deacetylase AcuC-like enzyme
MGDYHPECPERINAVNDRLIASGLDAYLLYRTATPATREQLARVHGESFIDSVEQASPVEGLHYIDPDTAMNPHSLSAATHAAGAVVMAVDMVMRKECATAFCNVRPPGHHAERRRAMGFCIFNSVAVGAAHALAAHGLSRVAVVDFDVHHGNGTEDIFQGDPRVLMVGSFQHPLYPYCGTDDPAPNMVNVPLPEGAGSDAQVGLTYVHCAASSVVKLILQYDPSGSVVVVRATVLPNTSAPVRVTVVPGIGVSVGSKMPSSSRSTYTFPATELFPW